MRTKSYLIIFFFLIALSGCGGGGGDGASAQGSTSPAVNQAPKLAAIGAKAIGEGETLTITLKCDRP
jgi:hypothetical protein